MIETTIPSIFISTTIGNKSLATAACAFVDVTVAKGTFIVRFMVLKKKSSLQRDLTTPKWIL